MYHIRNLVRNTRTSNFTRRATAIAGESPLPDFHLWLWQEAFLFRVLTVNGKAEMLTYKGVWDCNGRPNLIRVLEISSLTILFCKRHQSPGTFLRRPFKGASGRRGKGLQVPRL
jgi:hypothetical protein